MNTLGIDIGASKVAAALVKNGRVVRFRKAAYGRRGIKEIEKKLLRVTGSVLGNAKISGAGIGVPCPFDAAGRPIRCLNIPALDPLRLSKLIGAEYGVPVFLENDVKAAAIAELHHGFGRQAKNFIFVAFGTGIGGAIVIDGKLYKGEFGWAGEFGHTIIKSQITNSKLQTRDWEELASAQFLRKGAGKNKWAENAAIGLLNITYALAPEYIIIGGGLLSLWDKKFNKKVVGAMRRLRVFPELPLPKLVRAKTGERAGVLGAALLPLVLKSKKV